MKDDDLIDKRLYISKEIKAIKDYGKALSNMMQSKKKLQIVRKCKKNSLLFLKMHSVIAVEHKQNVIDAWKKRAASRAWIPIFKRNCGNCKYASGTVAIGPCLTCSGLFEDKISDNWEPKEVISQK